MQHIFEACERWQPLSPDDPLYDNRLRSYPDAEVDWVPFRRLNMEHSKHWGEGFTPDYNPVQMMAMGIFGDAYWGDDLGQQRMVLLPQDRPFIRGDKHRTSTRGGRYNYHGRPASLKREWWLDKGLICAEDPLGWFEWFCWYWLGRRIVKYDEWQIQRWKSFKSRHWAMFRGYPGERQALLHWAIRAPY